ncbi:hypothetical protein OPQ81_008184 [Rhizoctonia solani]|nr:hypothetical protein OPQ81_008184 [Rhizoctonia solani]
MTHVILTQQPRRESSRQTCERTVPLWNCQTCRLLPQDTFLFTSIAIAPNESNFKMRQWHMSQSFRIDNLRSSIQPSSIVSWLKQKRQSNSCNCDH